MNNTRQLNFRCFGFSRLAPIVCTVLYILTSASYVPAMEFGWGGANIRPSENTDGRKDMIWLIGDVRVGDYEKFRSFMVKNVDDYIRSGRYVSVSSNGGNVPETLKIAALLKAMYASVSVDYKDKCTSSCFLLFVGAVARHASFPRTLGIHRPYFEPSMFAGLTPPEAEKKQEAVQRAINDFLETNSVPRAIIERMNRTSSVEIYWLTREDVESIGTYPGWYEQLLISKCKYRGQKQEFDLMLRQMKEKSTVWLDEIERVRQCESKFVDAELKQNLRAFLNTS